MSSQVDEYLKSDDSNKVARCAYGSEIYKRHITINAKDSDIFGLMKNHRRYSGETYVKLYMDY